MQHAVIGPEEDQGLRAAVAKLIGKDQWLAVKDITGYNRSVFGDIRVGILIQCISTADVVDHLVSAGNRIAVYGNVAGMTQHHVG